MDEQAEGFAPQPDGVALSAAMLAAADSEDAHTLLRKQAKLVDLQIADMQREDKVRHWSLRVRHISDVLKLGFELAAAAIVTAIAIFIGGAVGARHTTMPLSSNPSTCLPIWRRMDSPAR